MAREETIRKYLVVTDSEKNYHQSLKQMLEHINAVLAEIGEKNDLEHPMAKEFSSIITYEAFVSEVFIPFAKDAFTEEEIVRMIELAADPVLKKMASFSNTIHALASDWTQMKFKTLIPKYLPQVEE